MFNTKFFSNKLQSNWIVLMLFGVIFCINTLKAQSVEETNIYFAKDFQVTNLTAIHVSKGKICNEINVNKIPQTLASNYKPDESIQNSSATIYLNQGTIFYSNNNIFLSKNVIFSLKKDKKINKKTSQLFVNKEIKKLKKQKLTNLINPKSVLVWFFELSKNYALSISNNYLKLKKTLLSKFKNNLIKIEPLYLKKSYYNFISCKSVKIAMNFYLRPPPQIYNTTSC